MRGGKRKGAGRKPSPTTTKKKQVILRLDQIKFLDSLPRYKASKYVRDAIDRYRMHKYGNGSRFAGDGE